ncbi:MAG: hypothetical protein JO288_20760 [Hyphomicrobiales bacterium]|nr:hypothetical protein [Hyphomicrobiales bacterium]
MVGDNAFPRRKRAGRVRIVRDPAATPQRLDDAHAGFTALDALDVARYVSDMTAQLEAMANAARLDLLAYFLGMAKAESELFVRTHAADQGESGESVGSAGMD